MKKVYTKKQIRSRRSDTGMKTRYGIGNSTGGFSTKAKYLVVGRRYVDVQMFGKRGDR